MKKINKNTLKSIIRREGSARVGLLPCKANPNSYWISPTWVTINSLEELDRYTSEYSYYNCNRELGQRVVYYIEG